MYILLPTVLHSIVFVQYTLPTISYIIDWFSDDCQNKHGLSLVCYYYTIQLVERAFFSGLKLGQCALVKQVQYCKIKVAFSFWKSGQSSETNIASP